MRIIAGEFRGRKLLAPESDTTRPITDRAKQSLFDVLAPLIPESIVYDLFAGTGSMGLECLSRGAARAAFFERDKSALRLLKQNVDALSLQQRSVILAGDLFETIRLGPAEAGPADLVFLDPPYRFVRERTESIQQLVKTIGTHQMKPGATVIFRHDEADTLELAGLTRYDQRKYGGMIIELLRHAP